jgi:hypothetical protein
MIVTPIELGEVTGTKLKDTPEGRARIAAEIVRYMQYCSLTETPWFPVSPKASHDSGIGG